MTTTINGSSPSITFSDGSAQTSATRPFQNRIINGAMTIDQRNAGASVTPTNSQYLLDRWQAALSAASKYSVQQNAGSVTPPVGFSKYLGATSLSSYSVGAGDFFIIQQKIEGFNTADLAWGTANAKTVTLSFQIYSSLTGTFSGSIYNETGTRRYFPFTYTVNLANTWSQISVVVTGCVDGTWTTDNSSGLVVGFSLGVGSTYGGQTANTWTGTSSFGVSSANSVVGTNGATFFITGVQLEVGSTATSFDYRSIGTELALCQRYYFTIKGTNGYSSIGAGIAISSTDTRIGIQFPVQMRTSPTASLSGIIYVLISTSSGVTVTSLSTNYGGEQGAMMNFSVASGLTAGDGSLLITDNSGSGNSFNASAEL